MSALFGVVCVSLEVHSIHFGRSNSGRHLHPYLSSLPTGFSFPLVYYSLRLLFLVHTSVVSVVVTCHRGTTAGTKQERHAENFSDECLGSSYDEGRSELR